MMKISDNAKGAVLMGVLALIYLFEGRELDYGVVSMPREGFIPTIVGQILLVCCIVLFIKEVFFLSKDTDNSSEKEEADDNFSMKKPLCLILGLLLYPLFLPYVGFLVLTPMLLFGTFRIFNYRTWQWSAFAAITATLVTYFVFEKWLLVLFFPKGILG